MKLIFASVICLSAYGPDHPPKYYDLLEDVTR